jgi:SAM-dependent methyltransferase
MKIKKLIIKFNNFTYPIFFPILYFFASISQTLNIFLHKLLMNIEWHRRPYPEWMDHDQDLNYQLPVHGKSFFLERGSLPKILASSIIKKKKINLLDLCSGDGFYSQYFFGKVINKCVLIDRDKMALERARIRLNKLKFIEKSKFNFYHADILNKNFSDEFSQNFDFKFDVVLFNAAIEHFTEQDLEKIFIYIKSNINTESVVFGYTLVEKNNEDSFDHHLQFFSNLDDLNSKINKFFINVKCFESIDADRHNLYFIASDKIKF